MHGQMDISSISLCDGNHQGLGEFPPSVSTYLIRDWRDTPGHIDPHKQSAFDMWLLGIQSVFSDKNKYYR